jgi:hypothetical protein
LTLTLAILTATGMVITTSLVGSPAVAQAATPQCGGPVTPVTGEQASASVGAGTPAQRDLTWDLTGATWHSPRPSGTPDSQRYPFRLDNASRVCVLGGSVIGNIPREFSRDEFYRTNTENVEWDNEAFRFNHPNDPASWIVQRDAYVENVSDAFDPNAVNALSTTYLDHVHAKDIRDDCIENEGSGFVPHTLVITNSLFEGCHAGISARPTGESQVRTGSGPSSLTMTDSLLWVKPNELGEKYCAEGSGPCATIDGVPYMGNHTIWKFSASGPSTITVRNTVFRVDMPTNWSLSNNAWPAGTYENVTLVWTGQAKYGDYPWGPSGQPAGVTVTNDVAVWDNAVAAWKASSPPPVTTTTTASPAETTTTTTTKTRGPKPR